MHIGFISRSYGGEKMIKDQEFLYYLKEVEQHFSGWDFSYITDTGRLQNGLLSWSYGSIVLPYLKNVHSMLDMGTGGGELLSKLRPLPSSVYATEAYKPNIPIASMRLEPLGIKVVEIEEDDLLPFCESSFNLIINRHESYSPKEVKRILSNDGVFITQQVGGLDCVQINQGLGASSNEQFAHWNLQYAQKELVENGFKIIFCKEEFPIQRFYDIGALVYYLKAIPWQVQEFNVDNYLEKLYDIHRYIQEKGYFDVQQHRFILKAKAI